MTTKKYAFAALAALMLAVSAYSEGSKEKAAPVGPPQPRTVAPFRGGSLPPRAIDPSWLLYQDGIRLFSDKRLGESLDSFKKAVVARSELFSRCAEDIDAALAAKEAKKSKDSLSTLVRLLADRDLIPQAYEAIREKAEGSIVSELGLIRETSPSAPLRGLIDATLLVVEESGISRVGDSIRKLKKAVDDLALYPEAEFWIGKVYLAEGELRLAELQVKRAIEMSGVTENSESRVAMLETLAGIYKSRGDLKGYESSLRSIADSSDLFSNKDVYFRNAMERVLGERGFDKFMALYRVDQSFSVGAFSSLGELYLESGRPIATIYLAAATNATLTRAIGEIKADEPGYSYLGLPDLALRILASRELSRFALEAELWKNLDLLGKALSVSGYRESAREIWSALVKASAPDPWGKKAGEELSRPPNASRRP